MVVFVVAGVAAGYLLLLRKVRHLVSESQRDIERRLTALTEAITMHGTSLAESVPSTDTLDTKEIEAQSVAVVQEKPAPSVEVRELPAAQEKEEIAPEIQVAIAAAAVALLGRNARVRSARKIPSRDVVSPWTQQGRVSVQSSHNLRTRG
jgi:hypothetical protein